MAFEYDYAKVEKEFGIIFDSKSVISQFGGVSPLIAFLNRGQFKQRLREQFGAERSRSLLQILIGIVCGADSMVGVARCGQDPIVKKYIGAAIKEAQLGRDVRSFSKSQIESLHELVISLSIYLIAQEIPQSEELIFDVDSTAVEKYGQQQGVEEGYIEKDKIESCYQYLLFRLHQAECFFWGTIRAGSSHSQNGYVEHLRRFLPLFKGQWRVCFRTDSGYFSEAAIDCYVENDADFFCKMPMLPQAVAIAQTSADIGWRASEKEDERGIEYGERLTNTEQGTLYRVVYKRTLNRTQLSIFGEEALYRYDAIATVNQTKEAEEVFSFYNQRAHIENNIRELKEDYAIGKIVTENFDANDVITQVTLMGYLLVTHFKKKVLPKNYQKMQLQTLRWRVFNIPGKLLKGAGRTLYRIYNRLVPAGFYARMFYRLKYLKSWVLAPPTFA